MCGIAFILSGVRIDLGALNGGKEEASGVSRCGEGSGAFWTVGSLIAALQRRGPDNIGCKNVILEPCEDSMLPMDLKSTVVSVNDTTRNENATSSSSGIIVLDSKCEECSTFTSPFFDLSTVDIHDEDKTHQETTILVTKSYYGHDEGLSVPGPYGGMHFIGATLQLRGVNPVCQPLTDNFGNILVYNGEIFGGLCVGNEDNDAEVLMRALQRCCSCSCHICGKACFCSDNKDHTSVAEMLSTIKGPWALVYWQVKSSTMWFGRDALGRRSLLIHWPNLEDKRLVLSSVAPLLPNFSDQIGHCSKLQACDVPCDDIKFDSPTEGEDPLDASKYWEELSCGIYSIHFDVCVPSEQHDKKHMVGTVAKHEWTDSLVKGLVAWNRTFVDPNAGYFGPQYCSLKKGQLISHSLLNDETSSDVGCLEEPLVQQMNCHSDISFSAELIGDLQHADDGMFQKIHCLCHSSTTLSQNVLMSAKRLLIALRESVSRRTAQNYIFQGSKEHPLPVALLFSGGLDSMILAALMDQCMEPHYEIDLLNVSFDGHFAPDRISAKEGVRELQRIAPSRRWRLIEIDADLSKLESESKHVMSLINPANTYMDLNIGISLWLAAGGDGWVNQGASSNCDQTVERRKYKSEARILLVGSGADEQCAGYGRHRTKFRLGGWVALQKELQLDMQRIWKRNLGRDDRCISDHGKEARFPFLDEDVIRYLLDVPLWEIAELDQPIGKGDKKILREVALLLGLEKAATLPKRAIQFGSRIARESNRKNFGSNRAANQASAGGVVIHSLRH